MKRTTIAQLGEKFSYNIVENLIPGKYFVQGGLEFEKPGHRAHTNDGPDGSDIHTHDTAEVFIILQGRGHIELNGENSPVHVGDVIVIEPGEDHHLTSSKEDPLVLNWLHAGEQRHQSQR